MNKIWESLVLLLIGLLFFIVIFCGVKNYRNSVEIRKGIENIDVEAINNAYKIQKEIEKRTP